MFTGCGALGMAEVMPDDGKVVTCEFDPYLVKLTRTFVDKSPHGKKITILEGYASLFILNFKVTIALKKSLL